MLGNRCFLCCIQEWQVLYPDTGKGICNTVYFIFISFHLFYFLFTWFQRQVNSVILESNQIYLRFYWVKAKQNIFLNQRTKIYMSLHSWELSNMSHISYRLCQDGMRTAQDLNFFAVWESQKALGLYNEMLEEVKMPRKLSYCQSKTCYVIYKWDLSGRLNQLFTICSIWLCINLHCPSQPTPNLLWSCTHFVMRPECQTLNQGQLQNLQVLPVSWLHSSASSVCPTAISLSDFHMYVMDRGAS